MPEPVPLRPLPAPDGEPPAGAPSLADAVAGRLRFRLPARLREYRPSIGGMVLAALVAAPALTMAGAWIATAVVERESASLRQAAAPHLRALTDARTRAGRLAVAADALGRPTIGVVVERAAMLLPAGATLAALQRDARGRLTMQVDIADPELLRGVFERDGMFARLRQRGQARTADGRMRVTLEEGDR